jgi:hypothetical protein
VQGSFGEVVFADKKIIPPNRRKTFKHNKPTVLEE